MGFHTFLFLLSSSPTLNSSTLVLYFPPHLELTLVLKLWQSGERVGDCVDAQNEECVQGVREGVARKETRDGARQGGLATEPTS